MKTSSPAVQATTVYSDKLGQLVVVDVDKRKDEVAALQRQGYRTVKAKEQILVVDCCRSLFII